MKKTKYSTSPQYYIAIFYVAVILFLTSLALIYSCFRHQSYIYLAVGIVGFIIGVIGLIEFMCKKRILPLTQPHLLREIVALIVLAFGVYVLRFGSLSGTLNWREKMVAIICFVIGMHALHLRGYVKTEDK